MIRQTLKTAFIVLTVSTLGACNNSDKEDTYPQSTYSQFFGEYDWIETNDNWSGKSTPAKIGHSKSIRLKENGIYQVFIDGKKVEERKYFIGKRANPVALSDSVYILSFIYEGPNCEDLSQVIKLENNTLFTRDALSVANVKTCTDCTRSVYTRRQPGAVINE